MGMAVAKVVMAAKGAEQMAMARAALAAPVDDQPDP